MVVLLIFKHITNIGLVSRLEHAVVKNNPLN